MFAIGAATSTPGMRLICSYCVSVIPRFSDRSLRQDQLPTNDGLVGFRRVGGVQGIQLVPDLAVSLPVASDGGKTYTFRLRRDIRYSNGQPVQPADFRRGIERVFEVKPPPSPGVGYFKGIVGASRCGSKHCDLSRGIVTDAIARTITFRLSAPDADFLTKLAKAVTGVVYRWRRC